MRRWDSGMNGGGGVRALGPREQEGADGKMEASLEEEDEGLGVGAPRLRLHSR